MRNTVLKRGPARFTMVGTKLPYTLHETGEEISAGLAKRLHAYALRRLSNAGFPVSDWDCEVYTMDGDNRPADRSYTVEFTNSKGGMIGLQGILTNHGWPVVDHGFCIDRN